LLEATGKTLFYTNYRKHLHFFKRILPKLKAEATITTVEEIKEIYKEIIKKIK